MYRGTTTQINFEIDEGFDLSKIENVWITFRLQFDKKTFKLEDGNIEIKPEEHKIILSLSQEDTLDFSRGPAKVQIRFLDSEENASCTDIVSIGDIKDVLQGGVIA